MESGLASAYTERLGILSFHIQIMGKLTEILQLAQQRGRDLNLPYAGALTPHEAWQILQHAPGARVIDVRTHAEWEWVGRIQGAIEIEWTNYPDRQPNPYFIAELRHAANPEALLLFICRSGFRSDAAARAAAVSGFPGCYNILEGFEGDKDAKGQRNTVGGWKHAGLPWIQS